MKKEQELMDNDNLIIKPVRPDLKLLTGGKPPIGSDWLSGLPVGTNFLSSNRGRVNGVQDEWRIHHKTDKHILLVTELNQTIYAWVDPKEFCSTNLLKEILEMGPEENESTGQQSD